MTVLRRARIGFNATSTTGSYDPIAKVLQFLGACFGAAAAPLIHMKLSITQWIAPKIIPLSSFILIDLELSFSSDFESLCSAD